MEAAMKYNIPLLVAIREKGWTQKDFAKIVGDHPTFVSRVVNGWVNLSDDHQAKYASVLDCKAEELFPEA